MRTRTKRQRRHAATFVLVKMSQKRTERGTGGEVNAHQSDASVSSKGVIGRAGWEIRAVAPCESIAGEARPGIALGPRVWPLNRRVLSLRRRRVGIGYAWVAESHPLAAADGAEVRVSSLAAREGRRIPLCQNSGCPRRLDYVLVGDRYTMWRTAVTHHPATFSSSLVSTGETGPGYYSAVGKPTCSDVS